MRWIKLLFLSVIIIFLLLTTIATLLPSEVRISRAIDINAPADSIFQEIAFLQQWDKWNLYILQMEGKKLSENSIEGSKLVIRIEKRKRDFISTTWQQVNGKKFTAGFRLIEHSSSTTVQWYFDFRFRWYPWEKFSSIVYDAQVGPVMQSSLENLKKVIDEEH